MLLSVVIPLYNKERSVRRAVDSFLSQSHPEKELIVVDDGSTDGSYAVMQAYVDRADVSLLRQPNAGVSAARNAGVRVARADYVCFLDADDEWRSDHLSTLASLIDQEPSATLFACKSSKVDERGEERVPRSRWDPVTPGRLDEFFTVYRNCSNIVNSSSSCVNKTAFVECGGFPEGKTTGEDIYVWFRLALMGSVMYSPTPTARIHLGAENRAGNRRHAELPHHLEYFLREGYINHVPEARREFVRSALLKYALLNCAGAVMNDNRSLARRYVAALAGHSILYAFAAGVLASTPSAVLTSLRRARHRLAGAPVGPEATDGQATTGGSRR